MDSFVKFFRDTLNGPLYIVVVVICVILIFACIGYLAEKSINAKKEKEKYVDVKDDSVVNVKPLEEINNVTPSVSQVEASSSSSVNQEVVPQEVVQEVVPTVPLNDSNTNNGTTMGPQVVTSTNVVSVPEVLVTPTDEVVIPTVENK